MVDFYREIAPKLRKTVVFNGDTDPCVSYEGTRRAVEKIGFAPLPGGGYRPWFFNATAATPELLAATTPPSDARLLLVLACCFRAAPCNACPRPLT